MNEGYLGRFKNFLKKLAKKCMFSSKRIKLHGKTKLKPSIAHVKCVLKCQSLNVRDYMAINPIDYAI